MQTILDNHLNDFLSNIQRECAINTKYIPDITNFNSKSDTVLYSGPYWDNQEITVAIKSLLSGKWLTSGEYVRKFEIEFCKKFQGKHAIMVNSGSSANLVMIAALKKRFNWKNGDEIIVSVVGFPTTVNPIIQNGLTPIFVDINQDDLNWDIAQIKNKITKNTVAVFSSPVLGNPYDFNAVIKLCNDNNLKLIADNCDSLGTKWDNKLLSSYAVASSHSFYPAHHISTGEGGLVMSDDEEIIKEARSFAWWGRDCFCVGAANTLCKGSCGKRFSNWLEEYDGIIDHKYIFTNIGYNLKPLDLQGAIGSIQLQKFDEIHCKRRSNKEKIHLILEKNIKGIKVIQEIDKAETSWFGVPIICESREQKTKLVNHLEKNRIQTRNYFAGNLLMHPAYHKIDNHKNYPNSKIVLDRVFFMGCTPHYNDKVINYIEETIINFEE